MTDAGGHDPGHASASHEDPPPHPGWGVLARGARLFDGGEHHAAHEVFEAAWRAARDVDAAEAGWWRALVLCAGALHHHGRGNGRGRTALAARAREHLVAALGAAGPGAWWRAAARVWSERWGAADLVAGEAPRLSDLLPGHGPERGGR